MKKPLVRYLVIGFVMLLLGIQLIRPIPNDGIIYSSNHINTIVPVSDTVEAILQKACYDCHSNQTTYPWYTQIQPIGFWLNHHVDEGKHEINFSEFAAYKKKKQLHKLKECIEMVEQNEMPLKSYTFIHSSAQLTVDSKTKLLEWFKNTRNSISKDSSTQHEISKN